MGHHLTRGHQSAAHYGVHEVVLRVAQGFGNPYFDVELSVTFTRPDGSTVTVDGFYDGSDLFKARAYCDQMGHWQWRARSNHPDLADQSDGFDVIPSRLKGKLRHHPQDARQFACADGTWFLHLGDTGYRYVVATEPHWQAYIEQAATVGFTKIRTWFCLDRSNVQALLQHDRQRLNLPYWQTIDARIGYALNHVPDMMLQLIPFGEDREEVLRYGEGDPAAQLLARYAQARFSAFPNVTWCISNDFNLSGERGEDLVDAIDAIGRDMASREPWGTLITNHQRRFSGYDFVDAAWSDIITLEDLGQVSGVRILAYRDQGEVPVVLDEDRYEHWRGPNHPRYFFRRLFWASLLSGGHATYGGTKTFEFYDGELSGLYGYYDACREEKLEGGAHDLTQITAFFRETGLDLVGWVPADSLSGDLPLRFKSIRSKNHHHIIVYAANPNIYEGHAPEGFEGTYTDEVATEGDTAPVVDLYLPDLTYRATWYDPMTGIWTPTDHRCTGTCRLTAPGPGDWVLLLSQVSTQIV